MARMKARVMRRRWRTRGEGMMRGGEGIGRKMWLWEGWFEGKGVRVLRLLIWGRSTGHGLVSDCPAKVMLMSRLPPAMLLRCGVGRGNKIL